MTTEDREIKRLDVALALHKSLVGSPPVNNHPETIASRLAQFTLILTSVAKADAQADAAFEKTRDSNDDC